MYKHAAAAEKAAESAKENTASIFEKLGLKEGDIIIAEGAGLLKDGIEVKL